MNSGSTRARSRVEYPPRRSLLIGRWQPLHAGHISLIRKVLGEGREVVIGIMGTPESPRNSYSGLERKHMFEREFAAEMAAGRLVLLRMPWIDEVVYGRDCGWGCRRVTLPPEMERITATEIRGALRV